MTKALLVEFLGTHLLTHVILRTGLWWAIGATLAALAYLGGPISGGSYNPAVTVALVAAKKLKASKMLPYILMEVLGALSAFQLLKMFKK